VHGGELASIEALAEEAQQIVGQCVLETALLNAGGRATYSGSSVACACGGRARFVGYRARWVKAACGEARIERAYYHCAPCKRGAVPWDRAQGLTERVWSPRLKALVCQVMGRLPYGEGVSLLSDLRMVELTVSSAEEIVLEVGSRIRSEEERKRTAFEEQQAWVLSCKLLCEETDSPPSPAFPVRAAQGERLYIEMDAAKAHIDREWHDVKVGGVFRVVSNPDGFDTPSAIGRSYLAAQQSAEEFGWALRVRAEEWGQSAYSEVVFLADGAECLWKQAQTHFPGATHILDFYHASEHIWTLARSLYRQDDPKEKLRGERWAKERVDSLKRDGPAPLIRALKRREGRTAREREDIRRERAYFARNGHRMQYQTYRAAGMMIGSGPIEAACKVVVGQRLKLAGMRWARAGADSILAIRTTLLSGDQALLQQMARAD
jgi:hypothetical protein